MSDEHEQERASSTDLNELADFVERMVAVAQRGGMSALEIKTDDLKIRLRAGKVIEVAGSSTRSSSTRPESTYLDEGEPEQIGYAVTSPMVGTFYHATSPADPPLVEVGDRVEAGQLIGIIEAMKIMNEITTDRGGIVIEIVAANATAVEYGSPLIRLGL